MDIYSYIKRENEKLFDRLETVRESDDHALQKLLLNDIRQHLPVYLTAKAGSLYRALRHDEPEQVHLFAAHRAEIDAAIAAMDNAANMDAHDWLERFNAVYIAVLRHLEDEEHGVFYLARRRINSRRAADLLRRMTAAMNVPLLHRAA